MRTHHSPKDAFFEKILQNDLERPGPGDGGGAVVNIKFDEDMFQVLFHRYRRNYQARRNFPVGEASSREEQHFLFPFT